MLTSSKKSGWWLFTASTSKITWFFGIGVRPVEIMRVLLCVSCFSLYHFSRLPPLKFSFQNMNLWSWSSYVRLSAYSAKNHQNSEARLNGKCNNKLNWIFLARFHFLTLLFSREKKKVLSNFDLILLYSFIHMPGGSHHRDHHEWK